jgi:Predicted hydrolases or acyltransferases (alpha/beta hydrolase superfamily)
MRKIVAGLSATVLGLGVALTGPGAPARAGAERADTAVRPDAARRAADATRDVPGIVWKRCEKPLPERLECGTLSVPVNHDDPYGRQITIALTRRRHTVPASEYRGILLLNPGGPGASGRELADGFVKAAGKAAAAYDVIGFDPRGVGASRPSLKCVPEPQKAAPYGVPDTAREERYWLDWARRVARTCEKRYGRLLPYMRTEDSARDMDYIRAALGQERLSFFGYSWGTMLGMTYATLFPERVDRMVLDSVVDPEKTWYELTFAQNAGFEKRVHEFFAWAARHHSVYRLGATPEKVKATYHRLRSTLKKKPLADGLLGPAELDELLVLTSYHDSSWPGLAAQLKTWRSGETTLLELAWALIKVEADEGNGVFYATSCSDSPWPRDWRTWRRDAAASHRTAPFFSWQNTLGSLPCAFWPVPERPRPRISGDGLPPILLVQSTGDPATPYAGALAAHRLLPSSRLVLEENGGNHAISLQGGNKCIDRHVVNYLATGALPADRPGPDATCAPVPPKPES